jgi:hypothetical protein
MLTKDILFELPDALSEPKIIKNFFPENMMERIRQAITKTQIGTEKSEFHTMLARWEASIQFDEDIEEYCVQKAKEIFNDDSLKKAYFFVVRYQIKDGCIPHLWEHTDQNGTQTTIDITIENTANWGLIVEGKHFEQNPNDAIIFCGQQHMHARPPYPTKDTNAYTTVLFLHFTQPEHWIQKNAKDGFHKYGADGDARFFNRNRYFAMPDGPINQPVCRCHDYSVILRFYDEFFGDLIDSQPEIVDMQIDSREELAPGIIKYKIPKTSARILKGLIQNAMFKQWEPAEVLVEDDKPGINYDARNCFSYFIGEKQLTCHPHDPIRRVAESLQKGFNLIIEDFRSRYSIVPLISHHSVLLRYEEGNKFHNHIDDHPKFPRVVSMSLFLNDDFEGGELEFKEFNLKIKPAIGEVVVFSSGFPYMHQVHPVTSGVRYAVVKWYDYKK